MNTNTNNKINRHINKSNIKHKIHTDLSNEVKSDNIPRQMISFNENVNNKNNKDGPKFYQIATPKSPHDLTTLSSDDNDEFNNNMFHSISMPNVRNNDIHHSTLSIRESEDMERLKYTAVKSEILDAINLHNLITNKEVNKIRDQINKIDAQMKLLNHLHNDKKLLEKNEISNQKRISFTKNNLELTQYNNNNNNQNTISFSTNLPFVTDNSILQHHYHTRSKSHGNLADPEYLQPLDSAILNARIVKPQKTTSKGTPQLKNMTSEKSNSFELHQFKPNQMNTHHRRVYSSSCLSNNSGIIGRTEKNEPIFRRYDGMLVIITCSFCQRANFTSAQGIVNHTRLKHRKTYSSQPLAVLFNQTLLPESRQDPEILSKFKTLKLDPNKDYLPYNIAIPTMDAVPKMRSSSKTQLSDHLSIHATGSKNSTVLPKVRKTENLKQLYKKKDFNDLLYMVDEAKNDLQTVLNQSTDDSENEEEEEEEEEDAKGDVIMDKDYTEDENDGDDDDEEEEGEEDANNSVIRLNQDSEEYSSSSSVESDSDGNSADEDVETIETTLPVATRVRNSTSAATDSSVDENINRRLRKRSSRRIVDDDESSQLQSTLKDRLRPAEKKVRHDIHAVNKLPEGERRSRHYNLRAKSKLRSSNSHKD